ncbi:arp2/3 complex-activating protein rickA-like isoform X2 [Panonychus citri]|uniref:arp2/3 complex-activating protein rickA-like isoform X2 n=1 Tax=Panonychus citri TaxID=50023 RepID=UPI00230714C6|nr:arp2/3 complex-activating protein rickA-like isoform X2 [Panonychus citri]
MDKILESKYELRRAELLEKYEKRSKQRRKRVKANGWITVNKLPVDFSKRRRRRPPKIDDDDEIESAVSSIDMIHCPTNNLTENQSKQNNSKLTHPPLVLDDLDVAEDFDPNKFDQQQQQQQQQQFQYLINESTQVDQTTTDPRTTKDLDILSEIINNLNYVPENDDQNFNNFHLDSFRTEPPQESILSSSSPFPASMLSPSIASTSPEQHQNQPQPQPPEVHKVDEVSSASSPSQSPPPPPQPMPTPSPPSPPSSCSKPTLTSSSPPPPPCRPPLQPSYGKDIFQMLEDANQQNQNESTTSDDESELDD